MSLRTASNKWNVCPETLRQIKINPEHSFHRPTKTLTKQEEDVFATWIEECAKRGFPRTRQDILSEAFKLVKRRLGDSASQPGRKWFDLFRRRKNLKVKKAEPMTRASGNLTKSNIQGWFTVIESGLMDDGLEYLLCEPSRIYNADESFFTINPTSGSVVVPNSMKNVYELVKDQKAGITVMLTIRADGKQCKPLVVYPNERIPASVNKSFPHDTANIAGTESGWMNSDTFCLFLKSLADQAMADGVDMPQEKILLFVDNHSSHTTLDSCKLAAELGIVLMTFYPNATFLYQPCDKTCFRSLKSHWKAEVRAEKNGKPDRFVSKAEFAEVFMRAFMKLKPEVVRNGFRASGIFPWSCEAIDFSNCLGQTLVVDENDDSIDSIINDPLPGSEESLQDLSSNDTQFIDLSDTSNEGIINEQNVLNVLANNDADPMLREFCRRFLNSVVTRPTLDQLIPAEENTEIAEESQKIVIQSIEVLPSIKPDAVLVIPPIPKRENKRRMQKTSPIVSSDGNIARLEKIKIEKKVLEEQKQERLAERIVKKEKKQEEEALKLAMMRVKSQSFNVSSQKQVSVMKKSIKESKAGPSSKKSRTKKENKNPVGDLFTDKKMKQMRDFVASSLQRQELCKKRKQELIDFVIKDCTDLSNAELKR